MVYRVLAEAVMLAHFSFLAFVALGGFLAWRWPRVFPLHAAAVAWGLVSAVIGVPCPLTAWEDGLRRAAGEAGLARGFIDTYLTDVIYPGEYLLLAQLLVAGLVAVSWAGLAVRTRRSRERRTADAPAER